MLSYLSPIAEQSFLLFPMAVGIYIGFSVLRIADLTVDGTFVLGAALFAKLMSLGWGLGTSMLAAIAAGALAGCITALLQRQNRMDPLIAGILMSFILYSVSLLIMQRPNIGLLAENSIFSFGLNRLTSLLAIAIPVVLCISGLLQNPLGLRLKAFGNNQQLVAFLGLDPEVLRMLGLSLSNALVALSGCITAQASGYADINMGFGQALIGIAMVLLGRELLLLCKGSSKSHDSIQLTFVFLGVCVYFFLLNTIMHYGLSPMYIKIAVGGFLAIFLLLTSHKREHTKGFAP